MKVWCVFSTEKYEGPWLLAIYSSKEAASKAISDLEKEELKVGGPTMFYHREMEVYTE